MTEKERLFLDIKECSQCEAKYLCKEQRAKITSSLLVNFCKMMVKEGLIFPSKEKTDEAFDSFVKNYIAKEAENVKSEEEISQKSECPIKKSRGA